MTLRNEIIPRFARPERVCHPSTLGYHLNEYTVVWTHMVDVIDYIDLVDEIHDPAEARKQLLKRLEMMRSDLDVFIHTIKDGS